MRIAFIAPFGMRPKGTVSFRVTPLARALAGRGHEVSVVIPPWDDPSAVPGRVSEVVTGPDKGAMGRLSVTTLPLPKVGPWSLSLTGRLVRAALNFPGAEGQGRGKRGPDVVHVFKPVGYSGLAGLTLAGLGVPWALDSDDWEGPGGWADVNPYSPAQKLAVTFLEAALPRLAHSVTAASRTLESRTWDFGLPRSRVFYLPNGVSREKYRAWGEWAVGSGQWAVGRAGESGPVLLLYTRFDTFPYGWALEVLARVRRYQPGARLLVVGGGFFGEEGKLREAAEANGLGESVTITGRVPESDLPRLLSQADVALYPMQDTLINRAKSPAKLLELMVAGLPIIAHRVGQTPEFLGDTGVLVELGDVAAMAEAASALLVEPERMRRLGQAARERVWREFSWERLSGVAEGVYRGALQPVANRVRLPSPPGE